MWHWLHTTCARHALVLLFITRSKSLITKILTIQFVYVAPWLYTTLMTLFCQNSSYFIAAWNACYLALFSTAVFTWFLFVLSRSTQLLSFFGMEHRKKCWRSWSEVCKQKHTLVQRKNLGELLLLHFLAHFLNWAVYRDVPLPLPLPLPLFHSNL